MILFTVLMLTLLFLLAFLVFAISVGGAAFIIIFSDVIVCAFIIAMIIWIFFKKKK